MAVRKPLVILDDNNVSELPAGDILTGGGSVTSVAMTVPTGLSISGSPITTNGTLALSFASGYSIPTTTKQGQWDSAYSWGNHASAGYALASSLPGYVPTSRTVNNKALSSNITLTAADVGAAATSHTHPLSDLTQSSATTGQVPRWDGSAWVAATIASGITWQTVSANTTMTTGNAYNVSGARNMTVGTAVVGNNYIVHAVDATVRVIAGAGREIRYANASVVSGATDALTLAKGETVWLVCNATNKLEIV